MGGKIDLQEDIMENLQTENILNLRDDIVISEAELRHIVTSEMIRVGLMPSLTGFRYFKEMVLISLQQKYGDLKTMALYAAVAESFGVRSDALERSVRTLVTSSFYTSNGFAILSKFFGFSSIELPSVGQTLTLLNEYILFNLFEQSIDNSDKRIFTRANR